MGVCENAQYVSIDGLEVSNDIFSKAFACIEIILT